MSQTLLVWLYNSLEGNPPAEQRNIRGLWLTWFTFQQLMQTFF